MCVCCVSNVCVCEFAAHSLPRERTPAANARRLCFFAAACSMQLMCPCIGIMSCSVPTSGDMIVHEITRNCSGVRVNFDVIVMPGMLWLYIGDGDNRFDALSFAAGISGQKIPASSCLMKGAEEDRGMPTMTRAASLTFPAFFKALFLGEVIAKRICMRTALRVFCSCNINSTVPFC